MVTISKKEKCCGASFENSSVSLLGLFLISCPFTILVFPFFVLIKIFNIKKTKLEIIYVANFALVRRADIFSSSKCEYSGKLFNISPVLGGAFFRFFNLFVLTAFWLVILFFIYYGARFLWG